MRLTVSILSFFLACVAGVGMARLYTPVAERYLYEPGFSAEEATAMVGRRVRHSYLDERFAVVKCPAGTNLDAVPEGVCTRVRREERGSIVRVERVTTNQCFLVVRWDEPSQGEPALSYVDATLHRLTLGLE